MLKKINYSGVHRAPSAGELICFRTLVVAYIHLQLHVTKSLNIFQFAFNRDKLLAEFIITGVKTAQARLYPGILWPGPIYTPGDIMASGGMNLPWPKNTPPYKIS